MTNFEAILFDLGGVILDIDYNKTISAFKNLGFHDVENWYLGYSQQDFFNDFETGLIQEEEFMSKLSLHCPGRNSEQILSAWNAMLGKIPPERVALLKKLKRICPVFLFSNTNTIHSRQFEVTFYQKYGFPLAELFHKVFYSFQLGLRKPDTAAFLTVAQYAGIQPERTLFVDDNPENICGAQKSGFQTIYVQGNRLAEFWNFILNWVGN